MEINKAAIIGLGAIGSVYGRRLCRYMGDSFAVIAGGKRAGRLRSSGFTINGETLMPNVVEPERTDWKADLVIFSVKNPQLDSAISDVKNVIDKDTVILTIMNGVSAHDIIKDAYPENNVLYGLSRSDASRGAEGVTCTWEGPIEFGEADNTVPSDTVKAVAELLEHAGIKYTVREDMLRACWVKFMRNVGMNQLSAVTGSPYRGYREIPELVAALREVMSEVVDVARAKGINLNYSDVEDSVKVVLNSNPEAKPSTLQDIEAGRKTEVDSFAGVVEAEGAKLGVPTPWNHALKLLIKTREQLH